MNLNVLFGFVVLPRPKDNERNVLPVMLCMSHRF